MKSLIILVRSAVAISTLALVTTAGASVTAFIKIGDIKGESMAAGHEDEIDVLSWSWGVTRSIPDGSTGSQRARGTAKSIDLGVTKFLEKATPKLVEACAFGNVIPEAILVLERLNGVGAQEKYFEIRMTNVIITSDSLSGSGEASETVTLNFEEVEMTYLLPEGNVVMSWNIEEGTP